MLDMMFNSPWFRPLLIAIGMVMLLCVALLFFSAFELRQARDAFRRMVDRFVAGEVDNALRRMWPLWLLFIACFAVVLFLNPMKAGLAIYGIGKIALAGTVGYLISYCVTARAHRPESLGDGIALGTALKCRTWIICACILAIAIGVP